MKNRSVLFLSMVLTSLLAPAEQAEAQEAPPFELRCPSGSVLVGVHGRQGWWMDGIGPRCAKLNSDGTLGYVSNAGYAGGTGGTAGAYRCPTGMVMTGFKEKVGTYINSVWKLYCRQWSAANRKAFGGVHEEGAFSSIVGGAYSQDACLTGDVGKGLSGRAGIYLDHVKMVC